MSLQPLQLDLPAGSASVRERELEVGRLVLRVVAQRVASAGGGAADDEFPVAPRVVGAPGGGAAGEFPVAQHVAGAPGGGAVEESLLPQALAPTPAAHDAEASLVPKAAPPTPAAHDADESPLPQALARTHAAHAAGEFLTRRVRHAVAALEAGPARRALRRVAEGLADGDAPAVESGLLSYGAVLERHGVHAAALEVYSAVMHLRPGAAAVTLHAARAARRAGQREAALSLYRQAGQECGGDAHMLLLVRIGMALVSDAAERALSEIVRDARRARNRDVLAIAREERARLRSASGRSGAAVRDLAAAAARYADATDRTRVIHRMAELLSARGDLAAAREALLCGLEQAKPSQRGHTVQRLRTLAWSMGDELELRRSRGQGTAGLVTLAPLRTRRASVTRSSAPALRRWRTLLARTTACH